MLCMYLVVVVDVAIEVKVIQDDAKLRKLGISANALDC